QHKVRLRGLNAESAQADLVLLQPRIHSPDKDFLYALIARREPKMNYSPEDQKKLVGLGIAIVLVLVYGVVFVLPGMSRKTPARSSAPQVTPTSLTESQPSNTEAGTGAARPALNALQDDPNAPLTPTRDPFMPPAGVIAPAGTSRPAPPPVRVAAAPPTTPGPSVLPMAARPTALPMAPAVRPLA